MPLVTKKYLVCDRCGRSVEVAGTFTLGATDRLPDGWERVDRERVLCPDCYPAYELMRARHKVETEEFMSGEVGRTPANEA